MKIWIENKMFELRQLSIRIMQKARRRFGKWNSVRIYTEFDNGLIRIHPWQLKLFKCVTPEDFYIVTGIYDALIKPKICNGYRNFKFSNNTYQKIRHILRCNYKWNTETQWGNIRAIDFTWALGSTPMKVDGLDDWVVVWDSDGVKGEIDGTIN